MPDMQDETCPRCGGTGVDPNPDAANQWASPASGGGLADALLAPLLDWLMRKTLALFFPKLHARCRYCRGAGRVPATGVSSDANLSN
jgi:hypothetical protein